VKNICSLIIYFIEERADVDTNFTKVDSQEKVLIDVYYDSETGFSRVHCSLLPVATN
jgi:hypothetical protein